MKDFSEDTKLIAVEEQISQSLEMLTQMELKKLELEIRKEFIESTSSKENVAYERVLEEIRAIEDKISEIKTEEIHSNIPLNSIPKRALQYFRLRRKVEIQEKIFEFLVPQL
ncbi:MAG: hypothetical protein GWN01_08610, partial [Nitrosopumilaceae archaeon]|nr:hypothetical protein [Nitrosopumilaceae archaeon]NIU87424.1 hypothetical protein [Nitrosopumilaceae archaeon]NIV65946.1 hypothetical protein [Nitrosopumilaceae archaeon]NIX61578.1 hypothetical protein [Nitrosopumilaceae archaeon]